MSTFDRLTMFFYLLTRGSPVEIDGVRHQLDGLPWGAVNGLIKALPAHDIEPVYTSKGGEQLARELATNLLGDVKASTSAVLEVAGALEHLHKNSGYDSDLPALARKLRASVWG